MFILPPVNNVFTQTGLQYFKKWGLGMATQMKQLVEDTVSVRKVLGSNPDVIPSPFTLSSYHGCTKQLTQHTYI